MATTKYIWDPLIDAYLMETDGGDATQAVYTVEPVQFGRVVSQRRNSTASYLHQDAVGSTRHLTGSAKTTTDSWLFDATGNEVLRAGSTDIPFTWIGAQGYYKESNGYYVRARHYDPLIVRWRSRDIIPPNLGREDYVYARNTPIRTSDPSGMVVDVSGLGLEYWCCEVWTPGVAEPQHAKVWTWLRNPKSICKEQTKAEDGDIVFVYPSTLDLPCPSYKGKPELFFVRLDPALDPLAEKCNCRHTDIESVNNGVLRIGLGGDPELRQKSRALKSGDIPLQRVLYGSLKSGAGAGKSCKDASVDDIVSCVKTHPIPKNAKPGGGEVLINCQTDVEQTTQGCCLCCFNALDKYRLIEPILS